MNNTDPTDWLYCDDCPHLSHGEPVPDAFHGHHRCTLTENRDNRVRHLDHHPHIVKPNWCPLKEQPAPGPDPADWLTTRQVAALHGVKPPTVAKWCRLGLLPSWHPGKEWLIRRTDAEAFTPPDPRGGYHQHRKPNRDS